MTGSRPTTVGGLQAARLTDVKYRQVDYWARMGVVTPSRAAGGPGRPRGYEFRDLVALAAVGRCARAGIDALRLTPLAVRIQTEPAPHILQILDFPLDEAGLALRVPVGAIALDIQRRARRAGEEAPVSTAGVR